MKKLKLYLVDDDVFKKIQSFSEKTENLSIKEYQSLLKGFKEVSTEFETAGHALLENLLNAIKEAFNLSFENKMNIVWAYL